jgi:hypothetical protein
MRHVAECRSGKHDRLKEYQANAPERAVSALNDSTKIQQVDQRHERMHKFNIGFDELVS